MGPNGSIENMYQRWKSACVALVSFIVPMFTIIFFFVGMGMIATKEAFDWVLNGPTIVRGCSAITRLMDDMASHKVL